MNGVKSPWRSLRLLGLVALLALAQNVAPPVGFAAGPTAPSLTNNPSLDVVVTNARPVLSFLNSHAGSPPRTYAMELSPTADFSGPGLVRYEKVPEDQGRVTAFRVQPGHELRDGQRWYWRARAVDSAGNTGPWATTRFFVDTGSDDRFMGLVRAYPSRVTVSSGGNAANIYDLDDPGQSTFWQSAPFDENDQWVMLDFGRVVEVTRIWMLSNINGPDGWLKDFTWQYSADQEKWTDVPQGRVTGNDTFRNIMEIPRTAARYWRLYIKDWHGYAAQINALCLYSPGDPPVPTPPAGKYVLVVGDQMDGFTFTQLARRIRGLGLGLDTLSVPHYEVSLAMVKALPNQPVAIVLSGNNAGYQNLPMFEYNGDFELIRQCDLPILGICCGHQMTAMAYGLTFARAMGWSDITAMEPRPYKHKIRQLAADPLFTGIPEHFIAPEVHGWAVYTLPEHYEVLARSSYVQSLKRSDKFLYGVQFHPEIDVSYNQAQGVLVNFLKMAQQRAR